METGEALTIGARVRMFRRRRGLSLEVAAGLAGITKSYLSMLELGQCGFNRRGLIEDLAEALGCSLADLTGQSYTAPDRATVEGSRFRRQSRVKDADAIGRSARRVGCLG